MTIMQIGGEILVILFFVAIFAAWVDAIAGGSGLISIPALVLAGLPPATAIATNKLQGSVGTLTSSLYFIRKGAVDLRDLKLAIVCTFVGSVLGGILVLQIDSPLLMMLLPVLLVSMGLYYLLSPSVRNENAKGLFRPWIFALFIASMLGFYDGFFGPGTGSLMTLAFVMLLGYGLPKATASAKVLNFVSNISALSYFIFFGNINWTVGILMMAGQSIGATLGAKMALDQGTALIKPVVVCVCFLMSASIAWQYFLAS